MNKNVIAAKEAQVNELSEKLTSSESTVVVEYRGLTVAQTMELRRNLREENVEFKIYKNSISQRAVEKAGIKGLDESLTGPNALAFSTNDAVAPSRVLAKFAKKNDKLVLKAGIIEGKVVDADKINEISKLPNRDGMIAMILGCFQSPIRNFAYAVKSIAEQKAE